MRKTRYIVHVDMDAFFASIEQRDNPDIRSRPVVVGADPKGGRGRGVVSTCSYEARRFGIHSAMPISTAYQKCPDAVYLPPDIGKYEIVSNQIFQILYSFTPDVEPVGVDEAFLDITGSFHLFGASTLLGTPLGTCILIKNKIKEKTGLTASIGLAPTKMAAKIASDLKKPDGLVEVTAEKLLEFLWPLEVRRIWGLGEKSEEVFGRMGIRTIGDLAKTDVGKLIKTFGKNGEHFWRLANGIDDRTVDAGIDAKSISNEITFDRDTSDEEKIASALIALCEKVSSRLRHENLKTRTVGLKIRLEGFHTYTRASTVPEATNFADSLYKVIKGLYNNFNVKGKRVRLVGVKASNLLQSDFNDSLFPHDDKKQEAIHSAVDIIKGKFGEESIYRAGGRQS